ncbi:uncharacterized protein LOC144761756 isoform X1 [Lissotriton helveticus]
MNTKEKCKIREQVLLTLGPMATLLPPDQLALELPRVFREVLYLQASLPKENTFGLIKPLEHFLRAGVRKACKEASLPEGFAALHNMISVQEPLSHKGQAAKQTANELLLLLETTQSKLLDAGAQASGIEKPLGSAQDNIQNRCLVPYGGQPERLPVLPSGTTMRQRNFSMLYNPTHHIAGRRLLPVLPSGTTMRQRNFSMLYNPTHHIAGRRLQPQWFPTDTIMSESRSLLPYSGERQPQWFPADTIRRESRSLPPYSGERLPVCLSRHRMRQRSFPLILSTPHHIAGRVWKPRWHATEGMIRQNNSLLLYTGERLPDLRTSDGKQESSIALVCRLINHTSGRQRHSLWHGTSGMFQRSSPILLNQICYVSERERATEPFLPKLVCFLKNHATQITSTVANILFG